MVGGLAAKIDVQNAYERAAVGIFQTVLAVTAAATTLLAAIAGNWKLFRDRSFVKKIGRTVRRDGKAAYKVPELKQQGQSQFVRRNRNPNKADTAEPPLLAWRKSILQGRPSPSIAKVANMALHRQFMSSGMRNPHDVQYRAENGDRISEKELDELNACLTHIGVSPWWAHAQLEVC